MADGSDGSDGTGPGGTSTSAPGAPAAMGGPGSQGVATAVGGSTSSDASPGGGFGDSGFSVGNEGHPSNFGVVGGGNVSIGGATGGASAPGGGAPGGYTGGEAQGFGGGARGGAPGTAGGGGGFFGSLGATLSDLATNFGRGFGPQYGLGKDPIGGLGSVTRAGQIAIPSSILGGGASAGTATGGGQGPPTMSGPPSVAQGPPTMSGPSTSSVDPSLMSNLAKMFGGVGVAPPALGGLKGFGSFGGGAAPTGGVTSLADLANSMRGAPGPSLGDVASQTPTVANTPPHHLHGLAAIAHAVAQLMGKMGGMTPGGPGQTTQTAGGNFWDNWPVSPNIEDRRIGINPPPGDLPRRFFPQEPTDDSNDPSLSDSQVMDDKMSVGGGGMSYANH